MEKVLVVRWGRYDHASYRINANCSCLGGSASWCKHVGSLAYVLVEDCEIKPLAFLKGLGIDLHARHSRGITPAQEKALRKRHGSGSFRPCDSDDFGEEILHLWLGVVGWH